MSDAPGRSDFESDDRANDEQDGWGSPVPAQYGSLHSLGPPDAPEKPGAEASPSSYGVDPAEDRWGVTSLLRRLQGESRAAHPSEGPGPGSGEGPPPVPSAAPGAGAGAAADRLATGTPGRPVRWYDVPSEPSPPSPGASRSVYPAALDDTERGTGPAEPPHRVLGVAAAGLAGAALAGRDGPSAPAERPALTSPAQRTENDLAPGTDGAPAEDGSPVAPPLDPGMAETDRLGPLQPRDSGFAERGRPIPGLTDPPAAPAAFSAGADSPPGPGVASRSTDSDGPGSPASADSAGNPAGAGSPANGGSSLGAGNSAGAGSSVGAGRPVDPAGPAASAASAARPIAGEPVATEAGIDPAALGPALAGRDSFLGGRGRRRRPGRLRTRATVRHIDIGSVLRVAAVFWLVILVALVLASLLLWLFADASGSLPSIDKSVRTLFSLKAFELHPGAVAMYTAAGGIVVAIAGMIGTVVFALIYNLIADVVGGIRVDLESVSVD